MIVDHCHPRDTAPLTLVGGWVANRGGREGMPLSSFSSRWLRKAHQ